MFVCACLNSLLDYVLLACALNVLLKIFSSCSGGVGFLSALILCSFLMRDLLRLSLRSEGLGKPLGGPGAAPLGNFFGSV